jgi:hypothetical protein
VEITVGRGGGLYRRRLYTDCEQYTRHCWANKRHTVYILVGIEPCKTGSTFIHGIGYIELLAFDFISTSKSSLMYLTRFGLRMK